MNKHYLLTGARGCGKLIWARKLRDRMPLNNLVEADYAYRMAGLKRDDHQVPFRAPHHTASWRAIKGALHGYRWMPGEVSLAHGGILYLDEAGEFPRRIWENLERLLLEKEVDLASGPNRLIIPVNITIVAGHDLCPCGAPPSRCNCTEEQKDHHWARIPGFFRDIAEEVRL